MDNRLTKWQGWGITALRVMVGLVFLAHGSQKLFVYGIHGVAGAFSNYGIPAPMVSAALVTAVEFLGGLALVLGLLTRWAALPLAVTMLVATLAVHRQGGFFLPDGFEYTLTLLASNVALILTGAGRASIDGYLANRRSQSSLVTLLPTGTTARAKSHTADETTRSRLAG